MLWPSISGQPDWRAPVSGCFRSICAFYMGAPCSGSVLSAGLASLPALPHAAGAALAWRSEVLRPIDHFPAFPVNGIAAKLTLEQFLGTGYQVV